MYLLLDENIYFNIKVKTPCCASIGGMKWMQREMGIVGHKKNVSGSCRDSRHRIC